MYHVAGEGVGWKLQNGVLTVYGNGALFLDPEDATAFRLLLRVADIPIRSRVPGMRSRVK